MKTTRIYLIVIAMLMFVSLLNIRDSESNANNACFIQHENCK